VSVLHGDHDFDDERDGRRDREISLGTSTMLGIFFVLTLLLAGFFAFGYSLGRKSALTAAGTTDDAGSGSGGNDTFKTFKPSPGTAAIQPSPGYSARDAAAANASAGTTVVAPLGSPLKLTGASGKTVPVAAALPAPVKSKDPDAGIVGDPAPIAAAPVKSGIIPVSLGTAAAKPAAPAGGSGTMVQVSAFTRQEDADVVVSALKRKGYNVFIRREPQDNFLHVQLGPYGSRKEAEAMKEKLSSDGFNAMVK
jgi:DedD protein